MPRQRGPIADVPPGFYRHASRPKALRSPRTARTIIETTLRFCALPRVIACRQQAQDSKARDQRQLGSCPDNCPKNGRLCRPFGVTAHSLLRARTRAARRAECGLLRRASARAPQAYRYARQGRPRLRNSVDRKLPSAIRVSASWWSWSEGFVARGTDSGFWSYRCVHGSGDRRRGEANEGTASRQLPQGGRWLQPTTRNSKNPCNIRDVAFAHAQLSNVFENSWACRESRPRTTSYTADTVTTGRVDLFLRLPLARTPGAPQKAWKLLRWILLGAGP